MLVQAGLCRTCSETTLLVFPRGGSNVLFVPQVKAGDRVVQTVEHTHQFDGTVADLDLLSIDQDQVLERFRKNLPEGNWQRIMILFVCL